MRYIDVDAEIEKMKMAVVKRTQDGTGDEFTNSIFEVFINALNKAPTADVMPRTKQAAIDYLEEIGWMEEHDRETTIATRNFTGLQY